MQESGSAHPFSLARNAASLWSRPEGTLPVVDGVRAFAVLWVIAYHTFVFIGRPLRHGAAEPLFRVANRGLLGVNVFFVLSGFLIGRLLLRELSARGSIAFRRFYARRALRILPLYYVCLGLYCLLDTRNADTAWANLLFVNNLLPESRQCMPWAWSLAIEEQFYIAFPLLLLVVSRATRHRLAVLAALLATGVVIRAVITARHALHLPSPDHARTMYDALYDKPHARFGELLAGVIAAHVFEHGSAADALRRSPWLSRAAGLLSLAVVVASAASAQPIFVYRWPPALNLAYYSLQTTAFAVAVAFLLLLCVAHSPGGRRLGRLLGLRILRPVAQLSYSAYLLHVLIIGIGLDVGAFGHAHTIPAMLGYLVAIPGVTLCAAAPFYLLVEKPLMNLRARR